MLKKIKTYSIGLDIGGTKMLGILYDGKKVITEYQLATPKDNVENFVTMMKAVVDPLLDRAKEEKAKVSGIGLSLAGVMDYAENRVLSSPNIPNINGQKVGEMLSAFVGLPVVMDNDAHCFVYAEAKIGAGHKYDNIWGMVIGTGIGGAWYHGNDVYRGAHGGASEPGDIIVDYEGSICLEEAYQRLMQNNPALTAEEAYSGDPLAEKMYEDFGRYLGVAMSGIVNILDPELIILHGGATQAADLFLPIAKKYLLKYIRSDRVRKGVKIVKSKLGKYAGAIGAAMKAAGQ